MKTHSIEWSTIENRKSAGPHGATVRINQALCTGARAFVAIVPAMAVVIAAAWLANSPQLAVYLQATLWASGFLFLGLALESRVPFFGLHVATGIALPILALLSSKVAVELAIVAAALVALWIAGSIFRR